jgi:hypothetical protein
MTRNTHLPSSRLPAALAAALFVFAGVGVSGAASAANTDPKMITQWRIGDIPPGTEGLDELDEVLVRGQRAAIIIADLEDDYYKRYNKLNKDNNYDVHCSYLNTDPDNPGSALRSRVCMPQFLIDAMVDWAQGRCEYPDFMSLDLNKDHVLSEAEAAGNSALVRQVWELDTNHDRRLTYVEFLEFGTDLPTACYQPPPPELVLVGGTEKWYSQMMKVTKSDPDLSKMADNLGDLYGQLRVLQKHAGKLEAQAMSDNRTTARPQKIKR